MLSTDKQQRKETPIATGCFDYFPDALAAVANVSFVGGQQHHPGQPMRWNKSKSTDHADCLARHLMERGIVDNDGLRHSAKVAWRALALLQTEIEAGQKGCGDKEATHSDRHPNLTNFSNQLQAMIEGKPLEPRSAKAQAADQTVDRIFSDKVGTLKEQATGKKEELLYFMGIPVTVVDRIPGIDAGAPLGPWKCYAASYPFCPRRNKLTEEFVKLGCPRETAKQIVGGMSFSDPLYPEGDHTQKWAYISGPMRGKPEFNFPSFDAARESLLLKGYHVISPADVDRNDGFDTATTHPDKPLDQKQYALRDFWSLFFISMQPVGAVCLLPGWPRSVGASAEFFLARWLGLDYLNPDGTETSLGYDPVKAFAYAHE